MAGIKAYLYNVVIALDQMLNALSGGHADETFSSRCWRLHHRQPWKVLRWLVDGVFFWDQEHCYTSFMIEAGGGHLPSGMREATGKN